MATLNIGGRTVEIPDDPRRQRLRAPLRFQDGGQSAGSPVSDHMRRVGEEWSRSNAEFEAGNPNVAQRVLRVVNPLTGFGSTLGAMHDAAGAGDIPGMALSAVSAVPAFAAARAVKTAAGPLRAAANGQTAGRVAGNTAGGVGADYYQPSAVRFQDGGKVPGTGRGDKIPAKYEPGEFVVSNDMIDDNPGLGEQLSMMREQTLAARGKTVEEADAGATRHPRSLRAVDGYDPLDRMARNLIGQNQLPPRSPMGSMADSLHRGTTPPSASAAPAPAAPDFDAQRLNQDARAQAAQRADARAQAARGVEPPKSTAGRAQAAAGRAQAAVSNTASKTVGVGKNALRWSAKAATPLGLIGGAAESLVDNSTGYRDQFLRSVGAEESGPWATAGVDLARTLSNVGNMLTGGYAERVGRGLSSFSAGQPFMNGFNENNGRTAREQYHFAQNGGVDEPTQGDPPSGAGGAPGAGAGSGIRRIDGGSSSLFTNVGADDNAALMGRGAVSAQNMGAADNLAQRSAALRQGAAAPQSDMILNSKAEVFGESGGFGLLDRNRLRQRELSMDAQQFKPGARTNLRAFNEQQINNDRFASEERVAQVKDATTRRGQDVDAASREYASDQTLRGQMYDANASAASAQAKAAGELAGKQNDLDVTNAKRTEEMFAIYNREGQPDPAATKNKMLALNKVIPGFTTMSEQARNQHQGDAAALSSIFDRARSQKELGLGQAIFGNDNPTLDSMPNFKGWALKRSGLAGALPGGAGVNGYYMEKDGQQFELGKGLSERELAMLKHNAATGKWIPSEK